MDFLRNIRFVVAVLNERLIIYKRKKEVLIMGFMNASQKLNDRSWEIVNKAFASAMPEAEGYTVCYGYWMKSGLMSKTMYNYAVGFKADTCEIILIPIDSDGSETGEASHFQKSDITAAKKTLQGAWRISSAFAKKPLELMVPGFVPDSLEGAYQLPINQQEQAQQFMAMMKGLK